MAGNGPPPSPNARRRNARPAFRRLPAAGRRGEPPAWPLGKPTAGERDLWADLWASPQAVAWEELGWSRTVARYARIVIVAERRGGDRRIAIAAATEARQLEDRLGLNPKSMRSLGWEIVATAEEQGDAADVVDIDDFRARVAGGG